MSATVVVPGRIADAEALWYDPHRWPAWIDGFGHVLRLEGDWPEAGARLVWQSPPKGRGAVEERVTAHEPRASQTVAVMDEKIEGEQTVTFEADGGGVRVTLALEYELRERRPLSGVVDALFIRRAQRESLRRTLTRFAHERRAEIDMVT